MKNRRIKKKRFVLVIDDDESHLETLSDILKLEELQPICCSTGKGALEAVNNHEVNVAILDLRLPDIDGIELLKQLKEQNPDIKVIVNTAYASLESALTAINEEAFAYVKKLGDVDSSVPDTVLPSSVIVLKAASNDRESKSYTGFASGSSPASTLSPESTSTLLTPNAAAPSKSL